MKKAFNNVDFRTLSLFRIVFATLLLKDAFYHLKLAHWFYSDAGIVPRSALFDGLARDARFSLMDAIGQGWMAVAFFLLWIVVLVCMLVGYRTRTATILNFIIILSIHERNVYILTGADTAMRVFSFWLMFTPAGRHYSVDVLRGKQASPFALPVRMLQMQLLLVYIVTAYLKLIGHVWQDGEALFYVLQLETIRLPLGTFLYQVNSAFLWETLSYFVLIGEVLLPILLLMPVVPLRVLGLLIGLAIHGGIALTLAIPDFSLVMLCAYILFFPSSWMDWIDRRMPPYLVGAPLQSNNIRYQFVLSSFLIGTMTLVIWWNLYTLGDYKDEIISKPPPDLIWYSGLWQYWDLFAPLPYQVDGWMRVVGHFENGTTYDLFHDIPLTQRPSAFRWGPDMRWKKFEDNVFNYQYEQILSAWGAYYCRLYNEDAVIGTRMLTLDIIYVYRRSHIPLTDINPIQTETLWYHWCF